MKIKGTNTTTEVSDELSIGVIISAVPRAHEAISVSPRSQCCEMFSVTINALSIIMPTTSTMPDNEMVLSEILNMKKNRNVSIMASIMHIATITGAFMSPMNSSAATNIKIKASTKF